MFWLIKSFSFYNDSVLCSSVAELRTEWRCHAFEFTVLFTTLVEGKWMVTSYLWDHKTQFLHLILGLITGQHTENHKLLMSSQARKELISVIGRVSLKCPWSHLVPIKE